MNHWIGFDIVLRLIVLGQQWLKLFDDMLFTLGAQIFFAQFANIIKFKLLMRKIKKRTCDLLMEQWSWKLRACICYQWQIHFVLLQNLRWQTELLQKLKFTVPYPKVEVHCLTVFENRHKAWLTLKWHHSKASTIFARCQFCWLSLPRPKYKKRLN